MTRMLFGGFSLVVSSVAFSVEYPAFYIGSRIDQDKLAALPAALQSLALPEQLESAGYVKVYDKAWVLLLDEQPRWVQTAAYSHDSSGFTDMLTPALDIQQSSFYVFNPATESLGIAKTEVLAAKHEKSEHNGRIRTDYYQFLGNPLIVVFEDKTICDGMDVSYPVETHVSLHFNGQS